MNVTFVPQSVSVSADPATMGIDLGSPIARSFEQRDPYTGDYEVSPSTETQTLLTKHLRMTDNVVINPIPQNYGLITWNGSYLTVS